MIEIVRAILANLAIAFLTCLALSLGTVLFVVWLILRSR